MQCHTSLEEGVLQTKYVSIHAQCVHSVSMPGATAWVMVADAFMTTYTYSHALQCNIHTHTFEPLNCSLSSTDNGVLGRSPGQMTRT